MDYSFEDSYIQKKFRLLLKDIIQEEIKHLKFDRKVQAVVVSEPTNNRTCSVVLNHNMSTLPENPTIITNVPIRSGVNVKLGDEVVLTDINSSNNFFVDLNKYIYATNFSIPRRVVSANTNLTVNDNVIYVNAASGNVTVSLPDSTKCDNKIFIFVRIDNTANIVNVNCVNGQLINGLASMSLGNMSSNYSRKWVQAASSNFWIINSN